MKAKWKIALCSHCNAQGHLAKECPNRVGNRLEAYEFCKNWQAGGSEVIGEQLIVELERFGELVGPAEISNDHTSAIVYFFEYDMAKLAVKTVSERKSSRFRLRFSHEEEQEEEDDGVQGEEWQPSENRVENEEVEEILEHAQTMTTRDRPTFKSGIRPGRCQDQATTMSTSPRLYIETEDPANAARGTGKIRPLTSKTTCTPKAVPHIRMTKPTRHEIYITELASTATEDDLRKLCEEVGIVEDCRITAYCDTGESTGFGGLVNFHDECTRYAAIELLDGRELCGRRVRVRGERKVTQHAMVTNFPDDWSSLDHEELTANIKEIVTAFGELAEPPDILEGSKQAHVEFLDNPLSTKASTTFTVRLEKGSLNDKLGLELDGTDGKSLPVVSIGGGLAQSYNEGAKKLSYRKQISPGDRIIAINNMQGDVKAMIDEAAQCMKLTLILERPAKATIEVNGSLVEIIPCPADWKDRAGAPQNRDSSRLTEKGRACSRSRSPRQSGVMQRLMQRLMQTDQPGLMQSADQLRKKEDASTKIAGKGDELQIFAIHLDELAMPSRPDVEPSLSDREVWVDPLPAGAEIWASEFGKVVEVFRIEDAGIGRIGNRGYVVFETHQSARQCVESGNARWSESERFITSLRSHRRSTCPAYPNLNMVSLLVGIDDSRIDAIKAKLGISGKVRFCVEGFLRLCGEGVLKSSFRHESVRLHFVCMCRTGLVEQVQPELEGALEYAHQQAAKLMEKRGTMLGPKKMESRVERSRSRSNHPSAHGTSPSNLAVARPRPSAAPVHSVRQVQPSSAVPATNQLAKPSSTQMAKPTSQQLSPSPPPGGFTHLTPVPPQSLPPRHLMEPPPGCW